MRVRGNLREKTRAALGKGSGRGASRVGQLHYTKIKLRGTRLNLIAWHFVQAAMASP